MTDLLARFRKRRIGQWAMAYVAAAWIVLQVIDVLGDRWNWPLSLQRGIDILLVVGFFVVIVLAWYHGEKGHQKVTGVEILALIGLFAIGGGLVAYVTSSTRHQTVPSTADSAPPARASVAVLPFAFEGAADWRWLADALAELVNTELARNPGVRVLETQRRRTIMQRLGIPAGSLSVEQARGIADVAGAQTVLTGRLRGASDSIRVTAELLETQTGAQVATIPALEDAVQSLAEVAASLSNRVLASLDIDTDSREPDAATGSTARTPIDYYRHLLEGTDAALDRRYEEGIEKFEKALAIDSTRVDPYYWLAWLYDALGDRATARQMVARGKPFVSELSEERRLEYLVMEAQMENRWRDYAAYLERLLTLDPLDATDHFRYGFIQFHRFRNLATGVAEMERAIELDSTYGWAVNSLGYAYLHMGEPESARAMMERYVALNPADLNPLDSRAEVAVFTGRYEQATADAERVLTMEPEFYSARLILVRTYVAQGRHTIGLEELDRYDRLTPRPFVRALGGVLRSEIHLQRHNWRDALASADAALEMDSTNAEAHWQRGRSLIALERYADARAELDHLDRVLRPRGGLEGRWLIHHLEGELALRDADFQRAVTALRSAVELGPMDRCFFQTALADAYRRAGQLREAITEYEAALAINPQHAFALFGLGEAHYLLGDSRSAESAFTRALAVWQNADDGIPEHALAIDRLGEIGDQGSGNQTSGRDPSPAVSTGS